MQSLFPNQLQHKPNISMIYTSDFDGQCTYNAAQNQNACFYEEGLDDFHGTITKNMVEQALYEF